MPRPRKEPGQTPPAKKTRTPKAPKAISGTRSLSAFVKSICDILRRSNCASALQYVPELTWILFLRILDEQERKEKAKAEAVGEPYRPALRSPYRWQDWAAPFARTDEALETHPRTDDGKPCGWKRQELIADSWQDKRERMKQVCLHCHTSNYVNAFYQQYDEFVINYNEKFAKPGTKIMTALRESNMITSIDFDEEIEWTWFYLWHHEGRRARHGASMMAPDYAHWHGMYEVAERFYMELIPMAREIAAQAAEEGDAQGAENVNTVIDEILARPEHEWFESMKKAKAEETASGLRARREGAESAGGG